MAFLNTVRHPSYPTLVSALDLGSSKFACVIARCGDVSQTSKQSAIDFGVDTLKIVGVGQFQAKGLKDHAIADLDLLEDTILNTIHQAEKMAQVNVQKLYVNLPGSLCKSRYVRRHIALGGGRIEDAHIDRIYENQSEADSGYQVIHVIPQGYQVDNGVDIDNPKGLIANHLVGHFMTLSAPTHYLKNISHCLAKCHVEIGGFAVDGYVSGLSCLEKDEQDLGTLMVTIGARSTSFSIFYQGRLSYIRTIPIGGHHMTLDLARGLGCPIAQAERLKNLYGAVWTQSIDTNEVILVPQLGERGTPYREPQSISRNLINTIIKARVEEIFDQILSRMKADGMSAMFWQRIVLTGGGSQLAGIKDLASRYFGHDHIRMGHAMNVSGGADYTTGPAFTVACGLLRYGHEDQQNDNKIANKNERSSWLNHIKNMFGM